MLTELELRPARADDSAILLAMIRELARFEDLADTLGVDEAALERGLFSADAAAAATLARWQGQPAGFALYFPTFWSFQGITGLYLEALFVREPLRGRGVGQALLAHVAALALARGAQRLDWVALRWNEAALDFYRRLGAKPREDWFNLRLEGPELLALAERAPT